NSNRTFHPQALLTLLFAAITPVLLQVDPAHCPDFRRGTKLSVPIRISQREAPEPLSTHCGAQYRKNGAWSPGLVRARLVRARRRLMRLVVAAICSLLVTISTFAQSDRGSITGTVVDPAKAVIQGAT